MKTLKQIFKISFLAVCIIFISNAYALDYLDDASQFFNKGDYNSAIIQLKNYLKDNPKNSKARLLLGQSYLKTWNIQLASKELRIAYQLEPSNEKIVLEYAHLLLIQNQYGKLNEVLNKKLAIEKNEQQRQIYRADALLAQKKFTEAKKSYTELLDSGANIQVYNGLANIAVQENDYKVASQWLEKSFKLESENTEALQISASIDVKNKDFSMALEKYNQLIKLQGNNLILYLKRAVIQIQSNDLNGAETDVQFVLDRIRNHPQANYMLAQIKLKEKNYKEAQVAAQNVLKVSPYHLESMAILGAAHFGQGNYNQADKYLTQYLSSNPDNINVQNILANVYLQDQGNAKQAILILSGIEQSKINSNSAVLTTLGRAYLLSGDYNKAVDVLKRANDLAPDDEVIQKKLIEGQFKIGEVENAMNRLEKMVDSEGVNKKTYILLISTYVENKEYQKAEDIIKKLMNRKPEELAPLYHWLAVVENKKGNMIAAKANYDRAIQENNKYIPPYGGLAELAIAQGDLSTAKNYYYQINQLNPKDLKAYMALASIAEKQNDPAEVEKQLRKALKQADYSFSTMEAMARVLSNWYVKQGTPEKIIPLAQELLKEYPENSLALSFLANAQYINKKDKQAVKTLKTIINNNNLDTTHRLTLAAILAKDQWREEEVMSLLDTVISIRPDSPKPLLMKANFYIEQKKFDKAIDVANLAEIKFPELVFGAQLKGEIYRKQNKFEEAIASFQKAYKVKPNHQLALILSDLLSKTEREGEALELLDQALSNNKTNAVIHLKIASIYLNKQQYNSAIKHYLKVLEVNPDHVLVLNNLAWAYAQEKNPQALVFAKKAYEISPESATILDTYGHILVKQGKAEEGIRFLKKAVKLSPDAYGTQYHLAQAYYLSGDKENALQVLKPLINIEKTYSDKENVKILFNKLQ